MTPTTVRASPTKSFFVKMLTRDIDLRDAILDLLDNCVDGIVRMRPAAQENVPPYHGFYANITAQPDKFIIEDNCGGIPRSIATDIAFRLGPPQDAELERLETVGVCGIGMKRAIFKMGRHAVVSTEHANQRFRVVITPEWLDQDETWDLPLEDFEPNKSSGTRIEVTNLHPEIKRQFTTGQSPFLNDLNRAIRELYAVIMGKGFQVRLNGQPLEPIPFNLLVSRETPVGQEAINPYVFRGQIGQVHVEVIVGFYRKPLTETELDEESESPRADLSQAGWSVVCNDRVVLRGDKSAVTGWGTACVPRFHNHFSSIAGVVTLRCADPRLLPLNTTKRGIETSSDVYFRLLDYMREGTKQFTEYTNRWKSRMEEAREHFQQAKPIPAGEVPTAVPPDGYKPVSGKRLAKEDASAEEFKPTLPKPPKEGQPVGRIQFSRPTAEVAFLAREMLDNEDAAPGEVGEECFNVQLEKYRRSKKSS